MLLKRSRFAWICFAFFLALMALLFAIAGTSKGVVGPLQGWSNSEAMPLLAALALLLSPLLLHFGDYVFRGSGIIDIYDRRTSTGWEGRHEEDVNKWIGAVLTVLSIRAGMTVGILGLLVFNRGSFLPPRLTSPLEVLHYPEAVFWLLIAAALGISIVTTMVALLCNEYAVCFKWEASGAGKVHLRRGDRLGNAGFYCLMWALAFVPVLLSHRLSIVSITAVYLALWLYYFFPPPESPGDRRPLTHAFRRTLLGTSRETLRQEAEAATIAAAEKARLEAERTAKGRRTV